MFGWSYQHWPRRCGRLWVTMLPPRPNRCDHKMYTPYHLVYPTAQEELRMIPVDVPIKQCPRQLHQPLLFPLNPRLPLVAIFYETLVARRAPSPVVKQMLLQSQTNSPRAEVGQSSLCWREQE